MRLNSATVSPFVCAVEVLRNSLRVVFYERLSKERVILKEALQFSLRDLSPPYSQVCPRRDLRPFGNLEFLLICQSYQLIYRRCRADSWQRFACLHPYLHPVTSLPFATSSKKPVLPVSIQRGCMTRLPHPFMCTYSLSFNLLTNLSYQFNNTIVDGKIAHLNGEEAFLISRLSG